MALELETRPHMGDPDWAESCLTITTSDNWYVVIEVNGGSIHLPIDLARKVARNLETAVETILVAGGVVRV